MRRVVLPLAVLALVALGAGWYLRESAPHPERGFGPTSEGEAAREPSAPSLQGRVGAGAEPDAGTEPFPGHAVRGTVVDTATGEPIAGARVVAYDYLSGERLESVTGPDGRYHVEATRGGRGAFGVRIDAPGRAPHLTRRIRASSAGHDVRLQAGGYLEGRVRSPEGGAVPGVQLRAVPRLFRAVADVDLSAWVTHTLLPEDLVVAATQVDAEGRFRVGPLAAGAYALVLQAPGRAPVVDRGGAKSWDRTGGFEVTAGATNDLGTLTYPDPADIRVRVTDLRTRALIRDVTFHTIVRVDRRNHRFPLPESHLQPDGTWRLRLHGENGRVGSNDVLVSADDHGSLVLTFSGVVQAGALFRVALPPVGRLRGHVLDDAGRPVAGAFVFVRQDTNAQLLDRRVTDVEGAFAMEGVAAEVALELVVIDATLERVLTVAPLTLASGEDREVLLGGPRTRAVEVTVRRDGRPATGAWVTLDDAGGRRTMWTTDGAGRVRYDAIPPGPAELYVAIGDRASALTETLDVAEQGVTSKAIDFCHLVEGSVFVEDEEGHRAALEDFTVEARPVGGSDGLFCEAECVAGGRFSIHLPSTGRWRLGPSRERFDNFVVLQAAEVEVGKEPPLRVELVLRRDPMTGTARIRVESAATGEMLPDGEFRYRYRTSRGAGTVIEGHVTDQDLGYGEHTYVVSAPRHAPTTLRIEISAAQPHDEAVARLEPSDCVRVTSFVAASRAEEAGVEVGDLLVRYAETRIRCLEDLRAAMKAASEAGVAVVRLTLVREGAERQLDLPTGRMGVQLQNDAAGLE